MANDHTGGTITTGRVPHPKEREGQEIPREENRMCIHAGSVLLLIQVSDRQ